MGPPKDPGAQDVGVPRGSSPGGDMDEADSEGSDPTGGSWALGDGDREQVGGDGGACFRRESPLAP